MGKEDMDVKAEIGVRMLELSGATFNRSAFGTHSNLSGWNKRGVRKSDN
jgi:hypothetical protein